MAQREVLKHQGAMGPDRAEEPGEDESDHGRIVDEAGPEVQW
jgi:hypothetical protein